MHHALKKFCSSRWFFIATVILFVFSALWIAFSARYPMAFDENYHYGIIKIYAQQPGPFIQNPPSGSESLGDITRYPSYLYHYAMSFPYRVAMKYIHTDQGIILFLRCINISFFIAGLMYFRKLLRLSGVGAALTNVSLALFLAIPNVLFLAAHINYDNLLILLTAIILYDSLSFILQAKARHINAILLARITSLNLLTCLVVFTHLPIFFATEVAVVIAAVYYRGGLRKAAKSLKRSFAAESHTIKVVSAIVLAVSIGLFAERYGYNQLKYQNLIPDCAQVVSKESCMKYGPWGRDYRLQFEEPLKWNAGRYFLQWAGQTMYELFFTINYNYANKPPLPVLFYGAWFGVVGSLIAAVVSFKRLLKHPPYLFFLFVTSVYGISLWINNYNRFKRVGFPVAIHGRYWMQLLPIMIALGLASLHYCLQRVHTKLRPQLLVLLALLALVCILQGGGAISYFVQSDASWYWPNSILTRYNQKAHQVLSRIVLH